MERTFLLGTVATSEYGIGSFLGSSSVSKVTPRPDHIEKLQEIKADEQFAVVFQKQF